MILRQYLDRHPVVAASYLFGRGCKGGGAVVDPTDEIDRYLADSESLGLSIRVVIDTHAHADHVSGGRRLAKAAGADYVLFSGAGASYPFRGVSLSGKAPSTIGFERWFNRAFSISSEEEFVGLMPREIPPPPERAQEIRAKNLGLQVPAAI